MASLREYFDRYFASTLSTRLHPTMLTKNDKLPPATVTAQVHYDDKASVKYVSVFIDREDVSRELMHGLLLQVGALIQQANDAQISVGHSSPGVFSFPADNVMNDYPFSGRVFIFADAEVDDGQAKALVETAHALGLKLELKDSRFAEAQSAAEVPLAFISHDSRDKEAVARELAENLASMLCPVWYDEYQLRPGDSLRESIDRGIAVCKKCVVILSPNFCDGSGWTGAEFNGAFGQHISKGDVIIPVWHNITRDQVAAFSPMIADIHAAQSNQDPKELARQVYRSVIDAPRASWRSAPVGSQSPSPDPGE